MGRSSQFTACDLIGWEAFSESGYRPLGEVIDVYTPFIDPFEQIARQGFLHRVEILHSFYAPGIMAPQREPNRRSLIAALEMMGTPAQPWTSCNNFSLMRAGYFFQNEADAVKLALCLPEEARQFGVD